MAKLELYDPPKFTRVLIVAREANETGFIEEIARRHAARASIIPWVPEEPVGAEGLQRLFRDLASAQARCKWMTALC